MARNLRLKIPADDRLVIFDLNQSASKNFLEEMGNVVSGGVVVAGSPSEVAEQSVRFFASYPFFCLKLFCVFCMMSMFHK